MKTKFNLVGDTFTHLTGGNKGYSVHGKESKYIEWVQDGSGVGTFYIDNEVLKNPDSDLTTPAYAWLLESKWISRAIDQLKTPNPKYFRNVTKPVGGRLTDYGDLMFTAVVYDMIFTHDKELIDLGNEMCRELEMPEKFKFVPAQGSWIRDPGKWTKRCSPYSPYDKTKLVSMIASNKDWTSGHMERLGWVKKLRGSVDLYGRGFNPIEFKEQGLDDYMFSVAIENGQYETYFTEKLLDCFLSFTIPIYSGAPDVGDYFNLEGILRLEEFDTISPQLYFEKYKAMCENYERALKMEVLEDYIWENYFGT